jgi:imidazolonepropionase-like amidohydrolase
MGSDAGSYALDNGANAEELFGMVDAGFDPLETLRIATHDTATMLGLGDEVGLLESGYGADILAVRGNPLDDIAVLANPEAVDLVVARGEVVVDET